MNGAGEVFRLRSWVSFPPKRRKGETGILSSSFKAPEGEHCVFVHLGNLPETEPLTEQWLDNRLRDIGLVRIDQDGGE